MAGDAERDALPVILALSSRVAGQRSEALRWGQVDLKAAFCTSPGSNQGDASTISTGRGFYRGESARELQVVNLNMSDEQLARLERLLNRSSGPLMAPVTRMPDRAVLLPMRMIPRRWR